jgi:uncharacterized protein (DUF1697 family)
MTRCVALLRGVNVGGHARIAMSDLRKLAADLDLAAPRTLLQSGNLVFDSDLPAAGLEAALESALAERFGHRADVMVRTAADWAAAIAANPFAEAAARHPNHLVLFALKAAPTAAALTTLRKAIAGPEAIELRGREAYITYPDGIGRSKLTNALIESRLETRGTGRNWNTVLRLAGLLQG